ncbi:hypothetical protein T484DRAFT_1757101, partial [Baffinella frigidus]
MIKNVLVGEDSVTIEQSILKAEYDPLYNAIRLFRLYELENTTPNLIKTIEETFKWTQSSIASCKDVSLKTLTPKRWFFDVGQGTHRNSAVHGEDPWFLNYDGTLIGFDPCDTEVQGISNGPDEIQKVHKRSCAITDDDIAQISVIPNVLCMGEGTECEFSPDEHSSRIYPVNHECFLLVKDNPTRESTGTTMITGAQDDRIVRFKYALIPPGFTFKTHGVTTSTLHTIGQANPFFQYREYTPFKGTWKGIHCDIRAFELTKGIAVSLGFRKFDLEIDGDQDNLRMENILYVPSHDHTEAPVFPEVWSHTVEEAIYTGSEIHSHVPRYLSDYYESVPRNTVENPMLHLYDTTTKAPSVRGMDTPMSANAFKQTTTFEPFPAIRFEQDSSDDTKVKYTQISREDPSKLAFAQFADHQLPGVLFDAAYPSALHTEADGVYVSVGNFRHLAQSKLNAGKDMTCDACVKVRRRTHARWDTASNPKRTIGFPVPPGIITGRHHTTHASQIRTFQDIITSSATSHNAPWNLLGETPNQFKQLVKDSLPLLYINVDDITNPPVGGRSSKWGERGSAGAAKKILKSIGVYSSDVDRVKINNDQLLNEYISLYPEEARLVYSAAKWPKLAHHWFEVYKREGLFSVGAHENKEKRPHATIAIPPSGVVAYEIGLGAGIKCINTTVSDDYSHACNVLKVGTRVYSNVVQCRTCTFITSTLCTGTNRCGAPEWLQPWLTAHQDGLNFGIREGTLDGLRSSPRWVVDIAWAALRTAVINQLSPDPVRNEASAAHAPITENFSILNPEGPVFNNKFQQFPLQWSSWGNYNPLAALTYEATTGKYDPDSKKMDFSQCSSEKETNFVDYTKCDMNTGIDYLAQSVKDKFQRQRGVIVPTGKRASWFITRDQMTGTGTVPFWANAHREEADLFASWILNSEEHCRNHNADKLQNFSPLDNCDYTYQPDKHSNMLDTICASPKCEDDRNSVFSLEQYEDFMGDYTKLAGVKCWDRDGQVPENIVVGTSQRNNLCSKTLLDNQTCTHPQGTLAGQGMPVESVYATFNHAERLSMHTTESESIDMGGLFVQPCHTVFNGVGTSALSDNTAGGGVRVSPFDIAGHHIRYLVNVDGIVVGDVMLQSYKDMEEAANQNGVGTEWLRFDEFSENAQVTPEITWKPSWTDWACPLRQQAFLSGERVDFRPQSPNQRRSRLLFSDANNNRFIHPTQKTGAGVAYAHSEYYTSNGVCACATKQECQFSVIDTQ